MVVVARNLLQQGDVLVVQTRALNMSNFKFFGMNIRINMVPLRIVFFITWRTSHRRGNLCYESIPMICFNCGHIGHLRLVWLVSYTPLAVDRLNCGDWINATTDQIFLFRALRLIQEMVPFLEMLDSWSLAWKWHWFCTRTPLINLC